ncbi:homoserine dehydrogenase [Bacillus pakistanensis]|uniref:Homoserine dehydrogenase n=1 Tax=Rossellomorea pakistanensis TaxID=992288 RepID=A0ABS2NDJ3_9BACI|nr:homoserine dehydrogenase [Bacillus pakistanensis]MBM7585929.1 homoserine dehydrogenase [Bacillus pakistanensis]
MGTINVALLGFGTVGQGVYEAIDSHQERLKELLGKEVRVRAILIKDPSKERFVDPSITLTTQFQDILETPDLDFIFEAIVGEEPSYSYLSQAIDKGIHIVTANKAMFAKYGPTLLEKAKGKNVKLGFEATTAGGIPVIGAIKELLKVNEIERIQGILNGTSNFILSQMRTGGLSFEKALKLAQEKGYAEEDPTSDIEGYDAFYKLLTLSQTAYGRQPYLSDITRKGITSLTKQWLQAADSFGLRFKHVGSLERDEENNIYGSVEPVLVHNSHPFYGVEEVENAISLKGSLVGRVTLLGPGAGKFPTASAILEDFLSLLYQDPARQQAESKTAQELEEEESISEWVVKASKQESVFELLETHFIIKDRINLKEELFLLIAGKDTDIETILSSKKEVQAIPVLKEIPLENKVKKVVTSK